MEPRVFAFTLSALALFGSMDGPITRAIPEPVPTMEYGQVFGDVILGIISTLSTLVPLCAVLVVVRVGISRLVNNTKATKAEHAEPANEELKEEIAKLKAQLETTKAKLETTETVLHATEAQLEMKSAQLQENEQDFEQILSCLCSARNDLESYASKLEESKLEESKLEESKLEE